MEITDLSVAAVAKGSQVTVSDTVTNRGGARVGMSLSRYYLSATTDTAGAVAIGRRSVPPLMPSGGASSGVTTVTIPATTLPGRYYLIVCTDSANRVEESDETNNLTYAPLTVN